MKRFVVLGGLIFLAWVGVALAPAASAVTYTWIQTGPGSWSDPLSWDANGVPVSGPTTVVQINAVDPNNFTSSNNLPDNPFFTGDGNVTVNFTNAGSSANPNLLLGNVLGWNGNLNVQSGYVKANRPAGDFLGNATTVSVAAGSTFDFANNGETFGGIEGA